MNDKKILPYEYLKGSEFTENLKRLTNCKTFNELSELLDVSKATFSTWNTHERTSHELMVRLHLALGIPVEDLAFGQKSSSNSSFDKQSGAIAKHSTETKTHTSPQLETMVIKSFCLANGQLIDTGEIPYPVRRMNSFNLNAEHIIEVETNEAIYLVDKSSTDPVSGNYLIDVDGRLSINHIQRFPGKKLAIAFGESTIEAAEEDIKVIGRVAVTLRKD